MQPEVKVCLSKYIENCRDFWFNSNHPDIRLCSNAKACLRTVDDFNQRFIQPATDEKAAITITGNSYMLKSILPPKHAAEFILSKIELDALLLLCDTHLHKYIKQTA